MAQARRKPRTARREDPRRGRVKKCTVCADRIEYVDYKDVGLLRRFMSERGKIKSRATTGACVQHQAAVALAIKNAREMALLPYAVRTAMGAKGGGRRRRDGGRAGGRPERSEEAAAPAAEAGAEAAATAEAPVTAEATEAVDATAGA